jgi:hypothetical protein
MGLVVRRCFQCSVGTRRKRAARLDPSSGSRQPCRIWACSDEGVELQLGGGLGIGDSNLLQCAFGLRLLALRQLGEYVRGPMHPATLLARFRPDLGGGLPEPDLWEI